jgi:hypothetical protein
MDCCQKAPGCSRRLGVGGKLELGHQRSQREIISDWRKCNKSAVDYEEDEDEDDWHQVMIPESISSRT